MRRALSVLVLSLAACASDDATPHERSAQCTPCHLSDFEAAPGHAGERPTTCAVCHSQAAWVPSVLDHRWPLAGAHAKARCFDCHQGTPPVFEGTSAQCFGCHEASFAHAVELNPWHAPFSHECTKCHTTAAWKPTLPHEQPPPPEPPPPPPAPEPSATASAPKPRPWPRPIPTAQPTTVVTGQPPPQPVPEPLPDPLPDVTTHASPHHR